MDCTFKDSTGREWRVKITMGTALDVLEELGVDLLNPTARDEGKLSAVDVLTSDPSMLAQVVFYCVRCPYSDKKTFLDHLDGVALKSASDAFWRAYENFFAGAGRADVARVIESKASEAKARATVAAAIVGELRRALSLT